MLLRSVAIRKRVFLVIWNSSLAVRILLRKSVMSLTFKPCVCTRIVIVARPSFSVSSSIFSDFACVGIYAFPRQANIIIVIYMPVGILAVFGYFIILLSAAPDEIKVSERLPPPYPAGRWETLLMIIQRS